MTILENPPPRDQEAEKRDVREECDASCRQLKIKSLTDWADTADPEKLDTVRGALPYVSLSILLAIENKSPGALRVLFCTKSGGVVRRDDPLNPGDEFQVVFRGSQIANRGIGAGNLIPVDKEFVIIRDPSGKETRGKRKPRNDGRGGDGYYDPSGKYIPIFDGYTIKIPAEADKSQYTRTSSRSMSDSGIAGPGQTPPPPKRLETQQSGRGELPHSTETPSRSMLNPSTANPLRTPPNQGRRGAERTGRVELPHSPDIVYVGDSLTVGYAYNNREQQYIAKVGKRVSEMAKDFDQVLGRTPPPKKIVLLGGTNDFYGRAKYSDVFKIIQSMVARVPRGVQIFIGTVPFMGEYYFINDKNLKGLTAQQRAERCRSVNAQIALFNDEIREHYPSQCIDFNQALASPSIPNQPDAKYIPSGKRLGDGAHPGREGRNAMSRLVVDSFSRTA